MFDYFDCDDQKAELEQNIFLSAEETEIKSGSEHRCVSRTPSKMFIKSVTYASVSPTRSQLLVAANLHLWKPKQLIYLLGIKYLVSFEKRLTKSCFQSVLQPHLPCQMLMMFTWTDAFPCWLVRKMFKSCIFFKCLFSGHVAHMLDKKSIVYWHLFRCFHT